MRIGQLYEPRDFETRVSDDLRRKQELRDQYNQFFEQKRYKRIRREFKQLADDLMEANLQKVGKERELAIRDLMNASFADALFTNDDVKRRQLKYKHVPTEQLQSHADLDTAMLRMDNDFTGEDALTHSIDLFQDLALFTKEYRFYNKQIKSPFMSFLSLMGEKAPNRFPKTFGLVHRRKQDEINIRSFYIPKDYIEPLATGIHFSENLRKLDLSRTQLSNESCHLIINSIPFKLRELALSHNKAI